MTTGGDTLHLSPTLVGRLERLIFGHRTAILALFALGTVLLGATAVSLDVGSWYHAKRALQAKADAAALAGAQALPLSTSDAQALAIQYAADEVDRCRRCCWSSAEQTQRDVVDVDAGLKIEEDGHGTRRRTIGSVVCIDRDTDAVIKGTCFHTHAWRV